MVLFNRVWILPGLLAMLLGPGRSVHAQITHTAAFTRLIQEGGIHYTEPVEQWLHVVYPPQHEYMEYDLVLQNDRNDFEIRLRILLPGTEAYRVPGSVEVTRLLATIATNDPLHEILVQVPPDELLRVAYNADRGVIAYFTPKAEFSEKPYGALLSLYAEERATIDIVILCRETPYDVLAMFRNIRFVD